VFFKWVALFGMLILVALSWFQGVKAFLGHKSRAGIGSIVSGVGLLVWALLAAYISPRDRFISPVEWGILVVGGIFIRLARI
jgi:hypothetical protein